VIIFVSDFIIFFNETGVDDTIRERFTARVFDKSGNDGSVEYELLLCTLKNDSKEDIADVKFSPNSKMVAAGSHDNYIYMYVLTR
jgi:hypothetical protein